MTTEQKQVKEFMKVFGQECPEKPSMPSLEVRKLRAKLIMEEALELITHGLCIGMEIKSRPDGDYINIGDLEIEDIEFNQYGHGDLTLIADGLADLHYVAYCGTALACGLDMEPIFESIHLSNMTKLWSVEEYAEHDLKEGETPKYVGDRRWGELDETKCWAVKNKADKIVKPPSFIPPNLQPIIDKQINK